MGKPKIHSSYLDEGFWDFEIAKFLARSLKDVDFDTVVFTGYSGAIVAPIVACLLDKKMIIVRKGKSERSHSSYSFEGRVDGRRYIFIDDCIESGKTLKRVVRTLFKSEIAGHLTPVGYCLWNDGEIKPVTVRGTKDGTPFLVVMQSVRKQRGKISRRVAKLRNRKSLAAQIASGGIVVVSK